jgi:hypothetical protein
MHIRAFDNLRDVRGLEYELDFITNRANRDLQVQALMLLSIAYRYETVVLLTCNALLLLLICCLSSSSKPVFFLAMQSLQEKATSQITSLEAEKAQLVAELGKLKGHAAHPDLSRRLLHNKENIIA